MAFLLLWCPRSLLLSPTSSNKTSSNSSVPPFYFLCISLSVILTPSYSLFFSLIILCSVPVYWLLVPLLTYDWLTLILFTTFKQKALEWKVCARATPQLETGFPGTYHNFQVHSVIKYPATPSNLRQREQVSGPTASFIIAHKMQTQSLSSST